jgi:hypothetical protein
MSAGQSLTNGSTGPNDEDPSYLARIKNPTEEPSIPSDASDW